MVAEPASSVDGLRIPSVNPNLQPVRFRWIAQITSWRLFLSGNNDTESNAMGIPGDAEFAVALCVVQFAEVWQGAISRQIK